MRGLLAAAAFGLVLVAAPAFAGPSIEPLGEPYWCKPAHHPRSYECGGVGDLEDPREPARVVTFKAGLRRPVHNFAFRVCSEAPSGKQRCVPRRTQPARGRNGNSRRNIVIDRFRFAAAFPHRTAGTYKVRWFRDGEQFGGTFRIKLTP